MVNLASMIQVVPRRLPYYKKPLLLTDSWIEALSRTPVARWRSIHIAQGIKNQRARAGSAIFLHGRVVYQVWLIRLLLYPKGAMILNLHYRLHYTQK